MVITQKDIAWAQDPENFGADCAWGIGANPTLKITPELLDWALKPENFRASFASGLGFNPTLEITPALLARLQAKENNDSSLATAAMIAMPTTPSLIEWCQQNENKNSNLAGIIGGRLWMLDSTVSFHLNCLTGQKKTIQILLLKSY
jgi:hypothetical protein